MTTCRVSESEITSACRAEMTGSTPVHGAEWAAGLLEGEGCFYLKNGYQPRVAVHMTDLDVLEKLRDVFGVGNIVSTQVQQKHHKPAWVWSVTRMEDAVRVMTTVRPYLFSRRRDRVDECLLTYDLKVTQRKLETEHRDRRIHSLRSAGWKTQQIANEVGLSRQAVSHILNHVSVVELADTQR